MFIMYIQNIINLFFFNFILFLNFTYIFSLGSLFV